ncbi:unnamed protein product [Diplocarpon coronariae]
MSSCQYQTRKSLIREACEPGPTRSRSAKLLLFRRAQTFQVNMSISVSRCQYQTRKSAIREASRIALSLQRQKRHFKSSVTEQPHQPPSPVNSECFYFRISFFFNFRKPPEDVSVPTLQVLPQRGA